MSVHDDLIAAARALLDAVQRDDSGVLVAGQWRGGNGGLLSRNTLVAADVLRRAIAATEAPTNVQ